MTDLVPTVESGTTPPPAPLSEYFRNLDDWVAGDDPRDPFIGELIEAQGYGDREKREFSQGREALWKLIPPITIDEIEESELDPPALMALGLALVLRARHALRALSDQSFDGVPPEPIPSLERLIRYVSDQLEAAGRRSNRGAIARMSALRVDMQELRAIFRDRAREETGETADATVDESTGMASARRQRRESLADRIRALLPGAVRAVTSPGAFLQSVTGPGMFLRRPEEDGDWKVDPQVPEPLGLYPYLAELDHWAAEQPLDEPFLMGLLRILKYGDAEKAEYKKGRVGLWGLIPPIDATQVADASLERPAAAALGLGVVAWGYQGLARYLPEQDGGVPPMLQQAGEIIAALTLVLDIGNDEATSIASPRLYDLSRELENRGVNALSALDGRRATIVEAHRNEVRARREAQEEEIEAALGHSPTSAIRGSGSQVSLGRLLTAIGVVVFAIGFAIIWPNRGPKIPAARTYQEVPAVAIIRLEEAIIVRVADPWLKLPEEERSGSAVALWKRFEAELDGLAVDLDLRTRKNIPVGGVHVGEAYWLAPDVPEGEPSEEGAAPGEEGAGPPPGETPAP